MHCLWFADGCNRKISIGLLQDHLHWHSLVTCVDLRDQDDKAQHMCQGDGQHQQQGVLLEALRGCLGGGAGHDPVELLQPFGTPAHPQHPQVRQLVALNDDESTVCHHAGSCLSASSLAVLA